MPAVSAEPQDWPPTTDTVSAVPAPRRRYRSSEEDSARWEGFGFREGDIVISTRSKSGTTWLQRICALLIFGGPELPEPLSRISPWLDWLAEPRERVYAVLAAQRHRRFIKTHTPLDGLPIDVRATYLVVARDPLDAAVSLYHQGDNIDRVRLRRLTGQPQASQPPPTRPDIRSWLREWIDDNADPGEEMDSLPGYAWHLSDAWSRRDAANVTLVRYDDLLADLDAMIRHLAARLGISVADDAWSRLVEAATFAQMRAEAARSAPDPAGVLRSPTAFFRRGSSGAGAELLDEAELRRYRRRLQHLMPPDLVEWLAAGQPGAATRHGSTPGDDTRRTRRGER